MLAILGASPPRFAPYSQLFREALERYGRAALPVGVHSPGHVAATDEQARTEFWPRDLEVIRKVSETRGLAIPTEKSFAWEIGPQGALHVGSPETVARKIAHNLAALGANRFDLKSGMGRLSHEALMTTSSCTAAASSHASTSPDDSTRQEAVNAAQTPTGRPSS
jgi:alkanesulfonate monooxygenase SsuD/methylene tetrahydromethanopterin reductase-like flavin-dependent oxidoreductase (luciferase family)